LVSCQFPSWMKFFKRNWILYWQFS
jgi:hypothetical protein